MRREPSGWVVVGGIVDFVIGTVAWFAGVYFGFVRAEYAHAAFLLILSVGCETRLARTLEKYGD